MTGFLIDRNVHSYLKNIKRDLSQTDFFYLCFLAGIASGKKDQTNSKGFSDTGTDKTWGNIDFKNNAELIALSLVSAESKSMNYESKEDLERQLSKYIDVQATSKLSREGGGIFNQYAAAGYKLLTKNISPPVRSEEFLSQVIELIQKTFKKNQNWSQ